MHAREGLQYGETPYFSDGWWQAVAAAVDEARQAGFHAWIYDEDRWPSGAAGGRTLAADPVRNRAAPRAHHARCDRAGRGRPGRRSARERRRRASRRGWPESDRAGGFTAQAVGPNPIGKRRPASGGRLRCGAALAGDYAINYLRARRSPTSSASRTRTTPAATGRVRLHGLGPLLRRDPQQRRRRRLVRRLRRGLPPRPRIRPVPCCRPSFMTSAARRKRSAATTTKPTPGSIEDAWFKQTAEWCRRAGILWTGHTVEPLSGYKLEADYFRTIRHLDIPLTDNEDFRYVYPRTSPRGSRGRWLRSRTSTAGSASASRPWAAPAGPSRSSRADMASTCSRRTASTSSCLTCSTTRSTAPRTTATGRTRGSFRTRTGSISTS